MALDFTGIVKKRVPFVPYVQTDKTLIKSTENVCSDTGHAPLPTVSSVSTRLLSGHIGHDWTCVTLEQMQRVSANYTSINDHSGHIGHIGHALSAGDVEFFLERSGIREDGGYGLSRPEADAEAFKEWRAWRNKRVLH